MESKFLDFLNSFGHNAGTTLGIIIGGFTIVYGIITLVIKLKNKYDDNIKKKVEKEQTDKDQQEIIQTMASNIKLIQDNISNIQNVHNKQLDDLSKKLDSLSNTVDEYNQSSNNGDIALESQLKTNEGVMKDIIRKISKLDEKTTFLIESDKEELKAYILDKYHEAKKQKYISITTLQTLDLLYENYLKEIGNTYVADIMAKLKDMPNDPPSEDLKQNQSK